MSDPVLCDNLRPAIRKCLIAGTLPKCRRVFRKVWRAKR